jgi:hypothetical protein
VGLSDEKARYRLARTAVEAPRAPLRLVDTGTAENWDIHHANRRKRWVR